MNTVGELNDIGIDAGAWTLGFSIGRALFLIHTLALDVTRIFYA